MTYDPDRDTRAPYDTNPNVRPYDRPRGGGGMALLLGLLAVLIIGGFMLYGMSDHDTVATNERPNAAAPSTTGSGATAPAPAVRDRGTGTNARAANSPTPPASPKQ